jgi:hypothetical protein
MTPYGKQLGFLSREAFNDHRVYAVRVLQGF